MISFNVFGCCVSRDALEILVEKKKACVLQCVGGSTTVSAFSKKLDRTYTIDDFRDYKGTKYFKRIACQDINKTAMEYLFEKKSQYLIIDLLPNRFDMFKKGDIFISVSQLINDNREKFTEDFDLKQYKVIKMAEQNIEFYKDSLENLCSEVLKHYSPNQIIINIFCGAKHYIHNLRKVAFNSYIRNHIDNYNKLINEMYNYIIPLLKGCHIINSPKNVLADPANKWGLYHLHFHDMYYEYNAKAIEVCCKNLPYDEEAARLEDLRRIYSEKFELLNLKLDMTAKNDQLKWAQNAAVFEKDLLLDLFSSKRFIDNLLKIKEKNFKVAVLKAFDYSRIILLKALETYGIEVVFKTHLWNFEWLKSEDFDKCRQADLVISANVHENKYPEKDGVRAILISDLLK